MGAYVATVNIPGYLPMSDEPAIFSDAQSAWMYLREEIEREELAYQPDDPNDPDGPASLTEAALKIEEMIDRAEDSPMMSLGTVYGPSYIPEAGEDTSTDLGLAYSVNWSEDPIWESGL